VDPESRPITFIVGNSASHQLLQGVAVLLVAKDAKPVTLGWTDQYGRIPVLRDELMRGVAGAVLFCKERFFCGAFRLDEPEFFDADERLIHLAPFAVP